MSYLPHTDQPCKECAGFESSEALSKQNTTVTFGFRHCKNDPSWRFKSPFTTCKRFARKK